MCARGLGICGGCDVVWQVPGDSMTSLRLFRGIPHPMMLLLKWRPDGVDGKGYLFEMFEKHQFTIL